MRPEFQEIVDQVSRLLDGPVTIEDRDFNLIAFCAQHAEQIDEIRQHSILERHSSPQVRARFEQFGITSADRPVYIPASPELGVLARLCLPARWNGVTYGYVWLLDEHAETDGDFPDAMALAERAGALLAQQARVREELGFKLQDLFSTDQDVADLAAEDIHELGIIGREVPVAAVELRLVTHGALQPMPMNLWSLPRSVMAAPGDDHVTLLVPLAGGDLKPARDIARRVREMYLERLPDAVHADVIAGIGAPRGRLAQARASWHEARLATQVGRAVPELRPIALWSELGVYRLLACGPQGALADAVIAPAVRQLLDHGDHDLLHSASVYLDAGGSVRKTAEMLNIHRQTVYYRMQRIEHVTGLDLSRGEHRLVLHLGLILAPALTARELA